ncbi:MAG: hypothetical protein HQ559_18220 [Lentisphaerae bacterium]|nr:hypothetical protein [Lentisphaerota bacterium]
MIANHIHDALAQVRKLQQFILERNKFHGYSGTARMVGGLGALAATLLLASPAIPRTPLAHLACWGCLMVVAIALNYGAVALWFLFEPGVGRKLERIAPLVDAVPALAVGGILSLALVIHEQYDFLVGTWMCLYGLAHISYRNSLPRANYAVGIFYMIAGAFCLLWLRPPFANPWPMGLVFFAGETVGGFILLKHNSHEEESTTR